MDEIKLKTFPSNRIEALTMLFLQKQDLSNLKPDELARKYSEVYTEIKASFSSGKSQKLHY